MLEWQRSILDVALEVDPVTGKWAYDNVVITVPRQAGKTTLLRPVIVHRMGAFPRSRSFMTAQSRGAAVERFKQLAGDVLDSEIWRYVKYLRGVANESLTWLPNGSSLVPFSPNGDGLHGESPDLVAIDELWDFDAEQARRLQAAYGPGMLTKNAQAWKFSTAGTSSSWWLNTLRATGRAGVDAGVNHGTAYFEWSLPDEIDGIPLEEVADEKLVQACIDLHPSPLAEASHIRSEWANRIDRNDFIRNYGNVTAEDTLKLWRMIPQTVWERATKLRTVPPDAPIGLGFMCDEDGREASVVAAFRDSDGRMGTELIKTQVGTQWVAGFVAARCERNDIREVATFSFGPSRDVADALERAGTKVLKVQTFDYSAACSRHLEQLKEGSWFHRGEPDLTSAASRASRARAGKAWVWGDNGDPVTALQATTLAGWAWDHAPEPVKPLPKFWMG